MERVTMVGDKTVKNAPAVDAVMTRLEPTQPIDATTEDSDVTLTNIDVVDVPTVPDNVTIIGDFIEDPSLPDESHHSTGSPASSQASQDINEFILPGMPEFVTIIEATQDKELYQRILTRAKKKNARYKVKHRRGRKRLEAEEIKDEKHAYDVHR